MRPTVILKAAMTLDGQLAAADGSSQWITSEEARRDAHECRAGVDAVMVGAGTVLADDPQLTVRLDGYDGPQPRPVIVTGKRDLPPTARLFDRDPIVLASRPLEIPGTVLVVPDEAGLQVDLAAGLEALRARGIEKVLVEGGAGLLAGLLQADLVDQGIVYVGARLAGGTGHPLFTGSWRTLVDAHEIEFEDVRRVGRDLRIDFRVGRSEPSGPGAHAEEAP